MVTASTRPTPPGLKQRQRAPWESGRRTPCFWSDSPPRGVDDPSRFEGAQVRSSRSRPHQNSWRPDSVWKAREAKQRPQVSLCTSARRGFADCDEALVASFKFAGARDRAAAVHRREQQRASFDGLTVILRLQPPRLSGSGDRKPRLCTGSRPRGGVAGCRRTTPALIESPCAPLRRAWRKCVNGLATPPDRGCRCHRLRSARWCETY